MATHEIRHAATNTTVTVSEIGATVMKWNDNLYLSPMAILDGSKPIRGGIPLVFPWFAKPEGRTQQHGFARNSKWKYLGIKSENDVELVAQFELKSSTETMALWAYEFVATLTITLRKKELVTQFAVKNTGDKAFDFDILFHTYLAVDDITKIKVTGLEGCKLKSSVPLPNTEGKAEITFSGEHDCMYMDTPDEIKVTDGSRTLLIQKQALDDTVVWNQWIEKAKAMADFPDEGYKKYVCVEVGTVSKPINLHAGDSWSGKQVLREA